MKEASKQLMSLLQNYRRIIVLLAAGMLIGVAAGLIEALFGLGLNAIVRFHERIGNVLLLGLPLGGYLIVKAFTTWGKPAGKGMGLVFEVDQGHRVKIPKRLAVLMIISTWITHLFGGSAGKEGVAVQVGSTVGNAIGRWLKLDESPKIFVIAGIAAGFAGLFQTPFTAIFFALEVLRCGVLRFSALAPVLAASFTASYTAGLFGLKKYSQIIEFSYQWNITLAVKLLLLGLLFGLAGQIFVLALHYGKDWAKTKFKNPMERMLKLSWILAVFLLLAHWGRYASLSEEMLNACFHQGTVYWYDWIAKLLATVMTLSIGFQGGEVAPLYTVGATLGCIIGPMLGVSGAVGAMLGFAGVFAAGTNTYLAAIMIGMEIFGYQYFPLFFIVCSVAFLVNQNLSIYSMQQVLEE